MAGPGCRLKQKLPMKTRITLTRTICPSAGCALVALGLLLGFAGKANAATVAKAGTGTDLNAGASWTGAATPTSADVATWTNTSLGAGLTIGANTSWLGISGSGALTDIGISGSGPLTLGASGIDMSASTVGMALATPIALGASQVWMASAGESLADSGGISGDFAITAGAPFSTLTCSSYLPSSPDTIFSSTSLSDVTVVGGTMGGTWVGGPFPATAYYFTNNGTTATYQMQITSGGYTKCVKVELDQSGPDITAYVVYAEYMNGESNLGNNFDVNWDATASIATSATSGGYGMATTTIGIGKLTPGTVVLSGADTYSGKTTVMSGTLQLAKEVSLYNNASGNWTDANIDVKSGATLALNVGGAGEFTSGDVDTLKALGTASGGFESGANLGLDMSNAGGTFTYQSVIGNPNGGANTLGLVKLGAGTLTLTAVNTYTGGTTINAGTLKYNCNADQTNSGTISGAGALEQAGPGTLTLSGNNSYSGGTTISRGLLILSGGNSGLGKQNFDVTTVRIQSGGTLDINGNSALLYGMTLAGSGSAGQGALINNGASIAFSGQEQQPDIALSADATIGGSGDFAMIVFAPGSHNTLTLNNHTLTKTGPNTIYLAGTTITAGRIYIAEGGFSQERSDSDASSAAFSLADTNGAGLDLKNFNMSIGSLTGGGPNGGNVVNEFGTLTVGGDNTSPAPYAGAISGSGTLIKTGTGTLVLTGTESGAATTVSNGTLVVMAPCVMSVDNAVTVAGGTLMGDGSINAASVEIMSGGTLAPGTTSIGTLQIGTALTLDSGSTTIMRITKTGGTLASDVVSAAGGFTYQGTLVVTNVTSDSTSLALHDTFQLFSTSTLPGNGSFDSFIMPALPVGLTWDASQLATSGSISVTNGPAIPIFSPVAGEYSGPLSVVMSCSTPGATIYYTTDNWTTTNKYTVPITVPANTSLTIQAYASAAGYINSLVTSATYSTVPSVNTGISRSGNTLTVNFTGSASALLWTTNLQTPLSNWMIYQASPTSPVTITTTNSGAFFRLKQ
jgi:fibronectin-binding autotransporter adhesin